MKYQKMTRFEKRENKSRSLEKAFSGKGIYVYQNSSSSADLTLPKPTKTGKRIIGPSEQFQGDDYFMQLVRMGNLRFIKEVLSPQAEDAMNKGEIMNDKLILDQPETVTSEGVVEQVAKKPVAPLNETTSKEKPDVLINENPVDDGFIIVGDWLFFEKR